MEGEDRAAVDAIQRQFPHLRREHELWELLVAIVTVRVEAVLQQRRALEARLLPVLAEKMATIRRELDDPIDLQLAFVAPALLLDVNKVASVQGVAEALDMDGAGRAGTGAHNRQFRLLVCSTRMYQMLASRPRPLCLGFISSCHPL